MSYKKIVYGAEAREGLKSGVDKACNAVRPTLGAVGMSAMIEYPGLDPIECDDGVTILRNIDLKDNLENMGVQMLRKAAIRTSTEAGDGTATTTVLTQALVEEAFKEIGNDGSNIREVRERLKNGLDEVKTLISQAKREVSKDDIEKIAQISSLDSQVASVIAEVINEVGIDGVVTVERSAHVDECSFDVVKGMKFNKGFLSPYFINNDERGRVDLVSGDVNIFLVDRVISSNEQVISLLKTTSPGSDVLIVADNVQGLALATLAQNSLAKIGNLVAVQNPYTGKRAQTFLSDLATMTGASVISEESGVKIESIDPTKYVGKASKVIVTSDTTTVIDGHGDKEKIKERIDLIKNNVENTVSEYQRAMDEERIAQLSGGMAVISVGAYTDTEFNAKKYKFENAVNATQAALQEGILPGGGSFLLHSSKKVSDDMFRKALKAPFYQMAENAGMMTASVITNEEEGYDFRSKTIVNMFDAGIIDSVKVTRLALESAVSIAHSLVGTQTAIVHDVEEKEKTKK